MFFGKKSRLTLLAASAALAAVTGATFASSTTADAAPRPTPAPAQAATVSVNNVLSSQVKSLQKGTGAAAETAALKAFWSPSRMKSAISLDKVKLTGKALSVSSSPQGASGAVGGQVSKVTPKVVERPKVSTNYDYPNFPYYNQIARTNGKIFFQRGSGYYVCSGAIVNTEGKSSIWTAGHCLYDYVTSTTRGWSYNVTFVPSYSNNYRPYGTWSARQLWVTGGWYYNRDFTQDNGSFTVNRNYGYRIADYLGAQGITWNNSTPFWVNAFGYPQAYPFNGAYLVRAQGWAYNAGNGTIYMYSGLTGGSSGGPWLRDLNYNTGLGYINGHNDFIYTSSPNYMYSPYYGNQVASLYNAVRYATS